MEIIRGKHASFVSSTALVAHLNGYNQVHIDIGTGDGRFVRHSAQTSLSTFVIGIDSCRENLYEVSRRVPENALFVIANAEALPAELHSLADRLTINFPWGSLLEGLLVENSDVLAGLCTTARPHAELEIRLNGGALGELGWSLEEGAVQVRKALAANGFALRPSALLSAHHLKSFPTSWAKRLAFGRDPRALCLKGVRRAG